MSLIRISIWCELENYSEVTANICWKRVHWWLAKVRTSLCNVTTSRQIYSCQPRTWSIFGCRHDLHTLEHFSIVNKLLYDVSRPLDSGAAFLTRGAFWRRFIDEDDDCGPLYIKGGHGMIAPYYWSPMSIGPALDLLLDDKESKGDRLESVMLTTTSRRDIDLE